MFKICFLAFFIILLLSCASERKPFMVIGEHNYNDTKGFSLSASGSFGSSKIRQSDGFDLTYENYTFDRYNVTAGAGFNLNRFAIGIYGHFSHYSYYREKDNEELNKKEPFTIAEKFKRDDFSTGAWIQYVFKILPNWDSHRIYMDIELYNRTSFKNTPSEINHSYSDKKLSIGYSVSFFLLSFNAGVDASLNELSRLSNYVGVGVGLRGLKMSFDFYNEKLEDEFEADYNQISVGYIMNF